MHLFVILPQAIPPMFPTHIAHGSTGAGNDQVRFDLIFQIY